MQRSLSVHAILSRPCLDVSHLQVHRIVRRTPQNPRHSLAWQPGAAPTRFSEWDTRRTGIHASLIDSSYDNNFEDSSKPITTKTCRVLLSKLLQRFTLGSRVKAEYWIERGRVSLVETKKVSNAKSEDIFDSSKSSREEEDTSDLPESSLIMRNRWMSGEEVARLRVDGRPLRGETFCFLRPSTASASAEFRNRRRPLSSPLQVKLRELGIQDSSPQSLDEQLQICEAELPILSSESFFRVFRRSEAIARLARLEVLGLGLESKGSVRGSLLVLTNDQEVANSVKKDGIAIRLFTGGRRLERGELERMCRRYGCRAKEEMMETGSYYELDFASCEEAKTWVRENARLDFMVTRLGNVALDSDMRSGELRELDDP